MGEHWEWRSTGLYDGEVPIVWASQTLQGDILVGVMADWEDVIAAVPGLLVACELAAQVMAYIGLGGDLREAPEYVQERARRAFKKCDTLLRLKARGEE